MGGVVVITRPEPDASDYAKELQSLGYDVFVEPMLSIKAIEFEPCDFSQFDGVLVTSANALRFYEEGGGYVADIPVYCVGKHTAQAARDIGFDEVISVDGTGADLYDFILKLPLSDNLKFIHLCGRHVAFPLVEKLTEADITAQSLIVYESLTQDSFSDAFLSLLRSGDIDAVSFFSKRTADTFVQNALKSESESLFSGIKALSISEPVVECVRVLPWRELHVSKSPDRSGIEALLKAYVSNNGKREGARFMSKNGIQNAEEVIEAFGGIRPMAKKIDVAVTTVQGWKKRNVIPANRRDAIIEAAEEHNVDLSDLIDGASVANENVNQKSNIPSTSAKEPAKEIETEETNEVEGDDLPEAIVIPEATLEETKSVIEETTEQPVAPQRTSEDKILNKKAESFDRHSSVSGGMKLALVAAILIALGFIAIAAYFWQQNNAERAAEAQRIAELEQQLSAAEDVQKDDQGFLKNVIPKDLNEKFAGLKKQAEDLQQDIGVAAQGAQEIAKAVSEDVLAEDAGNIQERLTKLEAHIQDITGKPVLEGMLMRVETLQVSPQGNDLLAKTVTELDALFESLQQDAAQGVDTADGAINATLDSAREQSEALGQSFQSVPQDDLKAAAMLLGMAQLRSALNRDNEAFETDLSLLKKVVGEENAELNAALDRLSPHAQDGVLTPGGLSTELRTFAGDAVVASLSGEDVSVQERAKARMNELFSVQKDGELITGTETQAALLNAEQQLQNGDIEGAIQAVQSLDGDAANALAPWLAKAQASLTAQDAKAAVNKAIDGFVGGELIRNEELGINVYTPKKAVTY